MAQANLPIYTDNLVEWFPELELGDGKSGKPIRRFIQAAYSISVTDGGNYQALFLDRPDFNTSPYASLSFWINGGSAGGQKLQVWGTLDGTNQGGYSLGSFTDQYLAANYRFRSQP